MLLLNWKIYKVARNKLLKFADNNQTVKVIQAGKPIYNTIKGNWRKLQFKNNNPIILEIACGRGEYTIGFARLFADRNFVGIDLKGSRLWAGAKIADNENLTNAAFLRTQMHMLEDFFEENEVDEIWIIHPDPRPKKSDTRRRLTSPRYMEIYKRIIKQGGWIHLKTDSTSLYEYSLEVLMDRPDIHGLLHTDNLDQSPYLSDHHGIKTRYELMFRVEGENIKYLKFQFQ